MSKRLHVGNLSSELEETDLENAFARWGGSHATIPFDRASGLSKGFGFVQVDDDHVSAAVAAMHGSELAGRTLEVCEARSHSSSGAREHAWRG